MRLTKINHYNHQHPLILKDPQEPYLCDGCKERGLGLCYECEHEGCNFSLHEECANASQSTYHPFLNDCNLNFHMKAPQDGKRYCDACGKDILGYVYQCNHKRPFDLHPCCVKLQRTLSADGVTIHLKEKLPSKCLKCGSKEIAKRVTGWCYVSSCEMILESWMKQQENKTGEPSCLALQRLNTSQEVATQSESSNKAAKLWKMTKTVILLIISAIFGDPTSLIFALAQHLFSN
ncbi:protein binding protein, putative [Ricinus communis]|uniref:Protein binding protein, putative n=1 Tax=Ricinus communis TaxID=3988 RepID=B9SXZ2_RICCO|nr:protein binding protein, putative [Ricinus communis]